MRSDAGPGDAVGEHCTGDQARACQVRGVKQTADHLATGQQTRDRPPIGVDTWASVTYIMLVIEAPEFFDQSA
jgi:hypothetical protein